MAASDESFMARALDLARSAPFTSPNPRVGAVLVRDGRIVSEGAHMGTGTPHAETVALDEVDATGATLYVTLEPCNHHGRTPPCAPAVADAGVARVVAAIADPDPRVDGSGFDLLRERGVEVTTGVLDREAEWLNAPFLHHRRTGRAFLSLKLALTLDGRLAAADRSSRWISGPLARAEVHRRRLEADAVMVGSGTVLADDPELTVRDLGSTRQPVPVIVDSTGRVEPTGKVLARRGAIVATTMSSSHERHLAWKEAGADVLVLDDGDGRVDLNALIVELGRRGMLEIFCEGGAELATSLLAGDLVDRLEIHRGAVLTGAGPGIGDLGIGSMAEAPRWRLVSSHASGDDVISEYARKR